MYDSRDVKATLAGMGANSRGSNLSTVFLSGCCAAGLCCGDSNKTHDCAVYDLQVVGPLGMLFLLVRTICVANGAKCTRNRRVMFLSALVAGTALL